MTTFVAVGNAKQPFARLLDAVAANASLLPQPVFVQHGHTPFQHEVFASAPFVDMVGFAARVREARLLIMHAGAGAVIHAIGAGKRPVVMPRLSAFGEHVDDHQLEFASAMARAGKAWLAQTPEELRHAIESALSVVDAPPAASAVPPMVARIQTLLAELAEHKI